MWPRPPALPPRASPTPGSQLAVSVSCSYHGIITGRDGEMIELEDGHRCHAEVENAILGLGYSEHWSGWACDDHQDAPRVYSPWPAISPCIFPGAGLGKPGSVVPWRSSEPFHPRPDGAVAWRAAHHTTEVPAISPCGTLDVVGGGGAGTDTGTGPSYHRTMGVCPRGERARGFDLRVDWGFYPPWARCSGLGGLQQPWARREGQLLFGSLLGDRRGAMDGTGGEQQRGKLRGSPGTVA